MAYDPTLYNPYGNQQFQPTVSYPQQFQPTVSYPQQYQPTMQPMQRQQPINGLTFIDIDNIDSYQMPVERCEPSPLG